jgi:hypothetical protein
VAPGGEATFVVRLRNTGTVVEQFTVELVGDTVPWATVTPPSVSMFPGTESEVAVSIRPPRSSAVRAGAVAFGVKVASGVDPSWSVVEEGSVDVERFVEVTAEMLPRTAPGRRSAAYELAIDNRGNSPLMATIEGVEPDQQLQVLVEPSAVSAEAGTTILTKVRVRPKERFRLGPPRTRPFNVVVHPEGGTDVSVDAAFVQEALLPAWLPRALKAAVALAVILAILWFTVLKRAVRSEARRAVATPLAQQQAQLNNVAKKVGGGAGTGAAGVGAGGVGAGAGGAGGGAGSTLSVLGNPTDGRVEVNAPAHNSPAATSSFSVPPGKTLSITDLVLENPQGDAGTMTVRRDGATLFSVQLANFRDLDYHFVAPLVFNGGQQLVVSLSCDTPGPPAASCSDAVTFAGYKV